MAKKVSFKFQPKSGDPFNVYGQLTDDGTMVATWNKTHNLGLFRIERFGPKGLTASTLRHVMTVGDLSE